MITIQLVQKEQKVLKLRYKNKTTGGALSLLDTTITLVIKKDNVLITKNDTDFDKTLAVQGIVKVTLTSNDLDLVMGNYRVEIKTVFSDGTIDKNVNFILHIAKSFIED